MSFKNTTMVWKNDSPGGVGIARPGVGIGGGVGGGGGSSLPGEDEPTPAGLDSYDDFEFYEETADVSGTQLGAYGDGWDQIWQISANSTGLQSIDRFESYSAEDPITQDLDAGSGWSEQWQISANSTGLQAKDDFESYPSGSL